MSIKWELSYYAEIATALVSSVTRFGKIRTFWLNLKSLGQILRDYLVFGKILISLWQTCLNIEQVFIVADGQIL